MSLSTSALTTLLAEPPQAEPAPSAATVPVSDTVTPPNEPVQQIMVAVHGIGDQFNFETIQLVVYQFCRYFGQPTALPLGRFHTTNVEEHGAYFLQSPPDPMLPASLGFAEIYWADIPRRVALEGYQLEESKKWARTLVDRVRLRAQNDPSEQEVRDYEMAAQVVEEMIQSVDVLDRIVGLASKCGLFEFNLKKLLTDFLGDVQLVAEFEVQRKSLMAQFRKIMEAVNRAHPEAEIFVISHSEGTVVSLLGLLQALSSPTVPAWAHQVCGYMTLGSPIDKHMTLWPELFAPYAKPNWAATDPADRIAWRNYYDYGDPVGFSLDSTRAWMKANGWDKVFEFDDQHDYGFERYLMPGKAHIDYWTDSEVFGHFIQNVVRPPDPRPPAERADYSQPPPSKLFEKIVSYVMPYTIPAVLLYVASYILYRAVRACTAPGDEETSLSILHNVSGFASLLGGMTLVTRLPRLTPSKLFHGLGVALFGLAGFGYYEFVTGEERERMGAIFAPIAEATGVSATGIVLGVAGAVGLSVAAIGRRYPKLGLKPLLLFGGLVIGSIVMNSVLGAEEPGPVWQLFPAGLAFLYLWWLAALTFDLAFTWHRYIRHSVIQNYLVKVLPTNPPSA